MTKNNKFNINDHFDIKDDVYVCKICKKDLKSNRNFNLRKHVKQVHKMIFNNEKETLNKSSVIYKTKNIKCQISKKLLIKSYIGLVTDQAISFHVLDSENMRNIINPICKGIEIESGIKFSLNSHNCKKALSQVCANIVTSISNECQNKFISLKVDSASRLSRNIFGISAQYMVNDCIQSRILGMVELKGQHCSTSKNLATEILNVLNKYNINLQQIISITSDNGSNMLKSSKILSHCSTELEEEDDNYDNDTYYQNLNLIEANTELRVGEIEICRCAAHTAQLCALDVTKNLNIKIYITNSRNIVKFLRKNSNGFRDLFELKSIKIPQLDCPTRWGSTFLMLNDLKNSKETLNSVECVNNKSGDEFEISEEFWNFIDSYCLVLNPLQKSIIKYQEEQLNYGDFYAQWLKCKIITEKVFHANTNNTNSFVYKISSALLESIDNRTKVLLSNKGFTACLYLDPRFCHLLRDNQKRDAIVYLKNLWERYKILNKIELNKASQNIQSIEDIPIVHEDEEEELLNAFLNQEFQSINSESMDVGTKIENINLPNLKGNTSVLDFWKSRKESDPELYLLSNICFAIPPTQVSVERAFSTLKLVLTDNRNRLSADTLENILLVKLNPSFLDEGISDLELFAHNGELV